MLIKVRYKSDIWYVKVNGIGKLLFEWHQNNSYKGDWLQVEREGLFPAWHWFIKIIALTFSSDKWQGKTLYCQGM